MKDFNSYFQAIPKMESERLLLTAFNREDMDAYFDILRDPEVQKYLGGFVKKTTAEISYHLSSDFWNRGLATEVVDRVTEFGLREYRGLLWLKIRHQFVYWKRTDISERDYSIIIPSDENFIML